MTCRDNALVKLWHSNGGKEGGLRGARWGMWRRIKQTTNTQSHYLSRKFVALLKRSDRAAEEREGVEVEGNCPATYQEDIRRRECS